MSQWRLWLDEETAPPEVQLAAGQRLIQALSSAGDVDDARQVLDRVATWPLTQDRAAVWLRGITWRLSPAWWAPVQGSRVSLRRLAGSDASWLKQVFADDGFASTVNRDYARRVRAATLETVAQQLTVQYRCSPVDLGAHVLVIESADGHRLGLASLVTIDADTRRAEYIIGFAGSQPPGFQVMEVGAMSMGLAFQRLGFHRITTSIYGDHPRHADLSSMLGRLGFAQEGILRQHVKSPDGRWTDLHLMGGLREEVLAQPLVRRCMTRFSSRQAGTEDNHGSQRSPLPP